MQHRKAKAAMELAAFACALLASACSDPLRPVDFAGEYTLVSEGGTELPLRTVAGSDTFYVFSERLSISVGRTARRTRVGETRRQNGSVSPFTSVGDYTTRVEDGALVMTFVCPPHANCIAGDVWVYREQDGVRLEYRGFNGPLRYNRVR